MPAKQSKKDENAELHETTEAGSGELTFSEALKLYDDAKQYVNTGFRNNWDDYFKIYQGRRVNRNYEGIADPVIREPHTIIETLVANIAGGNPTFQFVPTIEEQSKDTEVLNGLLSYYMMCNHMPLKTQEWVREMLLYGTGVMGVEWHDGKPFIFNIPLRDFFVDPTSTGMVDTINPARYAGYEYFADKDELARMEIFDADKGKMVPRYSNLEDIGIDTEANAGSDGNNRSSDKVFKDMFRGSTLGEEAVKRQVHVIKLYDLTTGRLYEIGNRNRFIYNEKTWCQREEMTRQVMVTTPDGQEVSSTQKLDKIDPFLPFAALRDYVDSSQFFAGGEMELIAGDSDLLNDYEAMDIDNNAYQNTPMYWIDPLFADLAPEIETIPGAVYPIPHNAIGALERPQLSGDLENKKQRVMDRMRRATAADDAVQGVAQTHSRTTATEVQSQISNSQQRFSTKVENLESEGFAQLASIIYKMVQTFVTESEAVRVVGPKGVEFKNYDPYEYNGEYEPHVELETTIKKKQMEIGQRDNQIFQALKDNPALDPVEVSRFIIQTVNPDFSDDKFNKLIAQPKQPPQKDPLESISLAYKDASPFVQGQIEAKLGLQPDPEHVAQAQNNMVEHAVRTNDLLDPTTTADNKPIPGMQPTPPPGLGQPQAPTPPPGM